MSKESDLWNRTIVELQYAQVLLRECAEYCNKTIRYSQDTSIILGKVLDAKEALIARS